MFFIFSILIPSIIILWIVISEITFSKWQKDFNKKYAPYWNIEDYVKRHNAYKEIGKYILMVLFIIFLIYLFV